MDSTVIEEIAKQLGMAVDQAGQFIAENLPAFAWLKVMQATVPLVISWSLVVLCAIVALVALAVIARLRKKGIRGTYGKGWSDYCVWWVFVCAMLAGAFALIVAVLLTGFLIPELIGWQQYPEAMLIDMALKAVG